MTRQEIRALVRLGAPVSREDVRAVRESAEVDRVETSVAPDGAFYIESVVFRAIAAPRSYPDRIENPHDPPTVSGTDVTLEI